ncbi:MAG TPA: type I secretion system permease/ATPase [Rhodobacteraceae bacterium]|jgi:ATP-binding cassette subfamily C protein|nr:type I secretion system permease/ATPase [Paracoccaceae bacterium]
MPQKDNTSGLSELKSARRKSRSLFWAVGIFSVFVNLLMLTGPIYMLQIYDRVLGSGSEETLLALSVLVTFLFLMMGFLDYARGRVLARIGARFQASLDERVFSAVLRANATGRTSTATNSGLRDLESVQRLLTSPVLSAIFDIPWTPIFLAGIFLFHPWLGILAISGGALLIVITVINQWVTRSPVLQANMSTHHANLMAEQLRSESELVQSLGMQGAVFQRWNIAREDALASTVRSSDSTGGFSILTKTFRMFLQSAMLGLGAYLVLQNQLTAGAMIAGSILMGRALAPIEQSVGQWALVQAASKGWDNLADLLSEMPEEPLRTELPKPKALLTAKQVTVVPPGQQQASLKVVNFVLKPGQAIGVIGPSGSGKSTLARAITGVWRPAGGKIRLDGAALDQYDPDVRGQYIGYLPQRVQLFDGTISENIARMSLNPDDKAVVRAAQQAAAHEMILAFPEGYDTRVTANGGQLSGGQLQRIGLARAMYNDPVILVLDEPNSNLDNEGSNALNAAIRQMKAAGNAVMIMAHRPAAIQECDLILMLDGGNVQAFGPRDEVLKKVLKNHDQVRKNTGKGGVV